MTFVGESAISWTSDLGRERLRSEV